MDPMSLAFNAFGVLNTFAGSYNDSMTAQYSYRGQKLQAESNAKTAQLNLNMLKGYTDDAGVVHKGQIDMFRTGSEQRIKDREYAGRSQEADIIALNAASGLGSAGTTESQARQVRNKTNSDMEILTENMETELHVMGIQGDRIAEQISEYNLQAGYAQDAYDDSQPTVTEEAVNNLDDTIQMGASGALAGAAIGSIIPGVGTAIGAAVGGGIGVVAGGVKDLGDAIGWW